MSRREQLVDWLRASVLTGGAQVSVQLLGFASGLLVIRCLTQEQYAYYTIANTALGAMSTLTDGGIVSGVLAQGGSVWRDAAKLGGVITAGLALRRRLAVFAVAASLPVMAALLRHQGASWPTVIAVSVTILPLFVPMVTGQLLEAVPRLRQHLLPLQQVQVGANLGRLVILSIVLPLWPLAAVASVAAAVPQWWANRRLWRLAGAGADLHRTADPHARAALIGQMRRVLPDSIYYALSGQLTVWLISIFGRTPSVAAVGALSRVAMILGVLGTVFSVVAVPRFARMPGGGSSRVRRRYGQSQATLALACAAPVALLAWHPEPILAVLGPAYASLSREIVLMAAYSGIAVVGTAAFALGAARGIVAPPALTIPVSVLVQVVLIVCLPTDTVAGVLWLGLLGALGQWALTVTWFVRATAGPALRSPADTLPGTE